MPEFLDVEEIKPKDSKEPKIPRIIPNSEITTKAEEIRTKRALPRKPGESVSFQELNNWFKLLTPDMVEDNRLIIYLYRLDPTIIRQKVDPSATNNIDVITDVLNGISEDSIIQNHGGGKYKLVVRDLDNENSKGGFFSARLTINQQQYPAKLDLREVDWDATANKGYKAYCRAMKLIDENNMPITIESKAKDTASGSDSSMVAAMKIAMDFATKMSDKEQVELKRKIGGDEAISKTMETLFLEKMKQEDPNKQLNSLTTILTAMKTMQPEPVKDNTMTVIMPMFMQMMTNMTESSNKQFTMMLELMKAKEGNGNGGSDKAGVITEVKELFGLFQDMNSNGGESRRKSTAEVIGGIVESNITPVLQIVGSIIAMKAGAPGPIPPSLANQTVVSQPQPSQPQQPTIAPAIASNEAANIINQFGPIIINKMAGEGWEFGAWIAEGFGDMTAASIVKYGVDNLLVAAKSVPQFWDKITSSYGEEHFKKWLASFVNYKEEIKKSMEEGEELEEVN